MKMRRSLRMQCIKFWSHGNYSSHPPVPASSSDVTARLHSGNSAHPYCTDTEQIQNSFPSYRAYRYHIPYMYYRIHRFPFRNGISSQAHILMPGLLYCRITIHVLQLNIKKAEILLLCYILVTTTKKQKRSSLLWLL